MLLSRRLALLAAPLLLALAGHALAVSVSLTPTSLVAAPNAKAQALTLSNKGDTEVRYQIDLYAWRQVNGKDELVPTREVMASPKVVVIPPKSQRVVRVVRMAGAGQAYYQLLARQLPPATTPGQTRLALLVNHQLKVAFEPAAQVPPTLTARRTATGYALTNTGNTAARIGALGPAGGKPWREGALGWVLPGATVEFAFGEPASALSVGVNRQTATVPVH